MKPIPRNVLLFLALASYQGAAFAQDNPPGPKPPESEVRPAEPQRGNPQRPQRRPQQQQDADGLVEPHQLLVGVQFFAQRHSFSTPGKNTSVTSIGELPAMNSERRAHNVPCGLAMRDAFRYNSWPPPNLR